MDAGHRRPTVRPGAVVPAPVRLEAARPRLDQPEVVAEFESILRFWLDRGVDGFRIDVAHGLAKDPEMPDLQGDWATDGPAVEGHPHWDRDEVHEVYRGWRRVTDAYDGDRVFVGEVWVQTPERLARYLRSDELHTAFNFTYLLASWDAKSLRTAIDDSIDALSAVGAPATWVLSNHDVVRHVTRYGGRQTRPAGGAGARGRATLLTLALPGGAYVYQGEELGLPEVTDLPPEVRQDPAFARTIPASCARTAVAACATDAGYRSRGRATRPRSASGPARASPGCPTRRAGRR